MYGCSGLISSVTYIHTYFVAHTLPLPSLFLSLPLPSPPSPPLPSLPLLPPPPPPPSNLPLAGPHSSCCYSAARQPETCSREGYILNSTGLATCPAPPRTQPGRSSGRLDDLTTYVSEHLLRVGETNRDAYENEYHLGFTVEDRPFFPLEFCANIANIPFTLSQNVTSSLSTSSFWTQLSVICFGNTDSRLAQNYIAALPGQPDPVPGVTVWYSNEVCAPSVPYCSSVGSITCVQYVVADVLYQWCVRP